MKRPRFLPLSVKECVFLVSAFNWRVLVFALWVCGREKFDAVMLDKRVSLVVGLLTMAFSGVAPPNLTFRLKFRG